MLTTRVENRDGIQLVHVSGGLDFTTLDPFKDVLTAMVSQSKVRIVLDGENLTHVNTKGLVLLGQCQRIALRNFSFFGLAALNRRIATTIEMLGMGKLVKLYATVEEAVQAASAP